MFGHIIFSSSMSIFVFVLNGPHWMVVEEEEDGKGEEKQEVESKLLCYRIEQSTWIGGPEASVCMWRWRAKQNNFLSNYTSMNGKFRLFVIVYIVSSVGGSTRVTYTHIHTNTKYFMPLPLPLAALEHNMASNSAIQQLILCAPDWEKKLGHA